LPIRKSRLSRSERAEHRAAAEQLESWGLIQKTPELPGSSALDIHVNGMASQVSEFPSGTVYYAISVEMIARLASLILVYCEITTRWDNGIIVGSDEVKSLCAPEGPVAVPDGILNGRIENGLRFHHCGDLVRGTIFAWGLKPIPDRYHMDAIVSLRLTFTTSLGEQFATRATAHVTRCPKEKVEGPERDIFYGVREETVGERERRAWREMLVEERSRTGKIM
jgi:hypothetical protein